jgi:adrenodoxin-NADP+ reductase
VRFIGNVSVSQDVNVSELRKLYDVVVLAYGAAKDRTLNIPGENLTNVVSARSFVGFYNGLPEDSHLQIDLESHENAVVVGKKSIGRVVGTSPFS